MIYRDYYQKMGGLLKFVLEQGEPVAEWRLGYHGRLTGRGLEAYLIDMERHHLIKRVNSNEIKRGPRKYGEIGYMRNTPQKRIKITPKGQRLISLIEGMAALMPTAPWILENDKH